MTLLNDLVRRVALLEQSLERTSAREYGYTLGDVYGTYMAQPMVVGFWPLSGMEPTNGGYPDLGGFYRTLSNNAFVYPPTRWNTGISTVLFTSTGQYLYRLDEGGLDMQAPLGIYTPGLTISIWAKFSLRPGAVATICGKMGNAGNISYALQRQASGRIRFLISADGTNTFYVDSSNIPAFNSWTFMAGRWNSGSKLTIWVNGTRTINTTSIPATIFNGNADFRVGGDASATLNQFYGYASLCLLLADSSADSYIQRMYRISRTFLDQAVTTV